MKIGIIGDMGSEAPFQFMDIECINMNKMIRCMKYHDAVYFAMKRFSAQLIIKSNA